MLQQGHFAEALNSYRQAVDLADQLSAGSPDAIFQANIRDPQESLYDQAIEAVLTVIEQSHREHDEDLLEFVLKALVPPRPVERTPINPSLGLILNRLAAHHRFSVLWPGFHRAHPEIAKDENDLRDAFRRDFSR